MISAATSTETDLSRRAFAHTAGIATHYENFTVGSLLLPRRIRPHLFNVYAFCRYADDLADEIADPAESLARLADFRVGVKAMYTAGQPATSDESGTLILIALQQTVRQFDIPADPFLRLLEAFDQDQRISRYETYDQLLDYCRRSADPAGHLLLYLCGYRDAERQQFSNYTCTGLQLANFWQDAGDDVSRNRIYLPLEDLRRFGVSESDVLERRFSPAFAELMRFEVDRTNELFEKGKGLLPLVNRRVRTDIALFGRGGQATLQAIRDIGYNTLNRRPTVGKWRKIGLLARYLLGI